MPLAEGIFDTFRERELKTFEPNKRVVRLKASKDFA